MSRSVRYVKRATRDLEPITEPDRSKIIEIVESFARGKKTDVKKFRAAERAYRLRSGRWRVVVTIVDDAVIVLRITDRKDAYRYGSSSSPNVPSL